MNIALTFDKNRLEEACTLIQSINEHNEDWNLFVFFIEDFSTFLSTCHQEICYLKPDAISHYVQPELRALLAEQGPNINTPFSMSSYIRLGLPLYYGALHLDKVLYLDTDILVYKDLQELYNSDISNVDVLGFPEYLFNSNYMNSGALLMNLDRVRKNDHAYSALMAFNMHHHRNPDQDCINLHYDKAFFDPKFGQTFPWSLEAPGNDPVLRHFSCWRDLKVEEDGSSHRVLKPWETTEHEHYEEWNQIHDRCKKIRDAGRERLLTNR